MSKSKPKPLSPFLGRWHLMSMSAWELDEEEDGPAFIEFRKDRQGEFSFGLVRGVMDYREAIRDGQPAIEWSWDGSDEMDSVTGRGWAVLRGDGLHGMLFFHQGDESEFVAERA